MLLIYFLVVSGGQFNLEFLAISLTAQFLVSSFCSCLFYRPPSSSVSIFDNLYHTLLSLCPFSFSTFLLIGDFMIHLIIYFLSFTGCSFLHSCET